MRTNSSWYAVFCFIGLCLLMGCAANTPSTNAPRRQSAMMGRCSERAIVFLRQGTTIRSDFELVEVGRRLGISLEVLQTMGRNSKMIMIRGNGPQEVCESAVEQLREDPRIESIQ